MNSNDINNDNFNIANIIKDKRKELGLSLKELENSCGISAYYINRLENNSRRQPSLMTIKKLCTALNLDIRKLPGILPELINVSESKNIIEMIKKEDISFDGIKLSIPQKNKISSLLDYILKCEWNDESKIEDIKKILDLVNNFKNIKP